MKKLIVLRGVMGAGKTHFSEQFVKENNYELIDYDGLFRVHNKDYKETLKSFIELVNASDKDIFCDGWFHPQDLTKVKDRVIEKWMIYASPEVCFKRFCKRVKLNSPKGYNVDIVLSVYPKIFLIKDYDKIIDYTNEPEEITREEVERRFNSFLNKKKECTELANYIKDKFDYYYQGFKFDCGVETIGLRGKNGDFLTDLSFREILKHVDFKGKRVLDLGCNIGYFCLKAKEHGAASVMGVENADRYLDIANKLKKVLNLDVTFIKENIITMEYPKSDIIFLLSIVHHFEKPFDVFRKAFKSCDTLLVEIDLPRDKKKEIETAVVGKEKIVRISINKMNEYAKSQGFKLATHFNSEKLFRHFLIYKREKK